MTLIDSNIKLWPISGCITMTLPLRAEPTKMGRELNTTNICVLGVCQISGSSRKTSFHPAIESTNKLQEIIVE
jgi:hypothetical protein